MEIFSYLSNQVKDTPLKINFSVGFFANRPVYLFKDFLKNLRENVYLAGLTTMTANIVFFHVAVRVTERAVMFFEDKGFFVLDCEAMSGRILTFSLLALEVSGMNIIFNRYFRSELTPLTSGLIAAGTCLSFYIYYAKQALDS